MSLDAGNPASVQEANPDSAFCAGCPELWHPSLRGAFGPGCKEASWE